MFVLKLSFGSFCKKNLFVCQAQGSLVSTGTAKDEWSLKGPWGQGQMVIVISVKVSVYIQPAW